MKTPAKRNPLAWLAALLMGVVLWGCKTDHDESIRVTDANTVACSEIDRATPINPELWVVIDSGPDWLIP